jgi:hypothetical protein
MVLRIFILLGICGVFLNAWGKVIVASKNGQAPYEAGLQVQLQGECKLSIGPATVYENVLGDVPCYQQEYSIVRTLWSVSNYGLINDLQDTSCSPFVWDVTGPCHFTALTVRETGIKYWSTSVLCSKCYHCNVINDSSSESYKFDIYPPCPKDAKVTYIEGTVTVDGIAVKDGSTVNMGGNVATGSNGRIELTFEDGSVARLGPGSELNINCGEGLVDHSANYKLTLILGSVWFKIQKIMGFDEYHEIQTENAVCGNRGTEYEVSYGGTVTRVIVGAGKVMVKNIAGTDSLLLGKCEAATVNDAGVIESVDPYSTENVRCGGQGVKPGLHSIPGYSIFKSTVEYYALDGRRLTLGQNKNISEHGSLVIRKTIRENGMWQIEKIIRE